MKNLISFAVIIAIVAAFMTTNSSCTKTKWVKITDTVVKMDTVIKMDTIRIKLDSIVIDSFVVRDTVVHDSIIANGDNVTGSGCHCGLSGATWYRTSALPGLVMHNALLVTFDGSDNLTAFQADSGNINFAAATMRNLKTGAVLPIPTSLTNYQVWWNASVPQLSLVTDTSVLRSSGCILVLSLLNTSYSSVAAGQFSFETKRVRIVDSGYHYPGLPRPSPGWLVGTDTCGLFGDMLEVYGVWGGYQYSLSTLQGNGNWRTPLETDIGEHNFLWLRKR